MKRVSEADLHITWHLAPDMELGENLFRELPQVAKGFSVARD